MDKKLEQRMKDYEMPAAFYMEMKEEIGKEKALKIVRRALDKMQFKAAEELKEKLGGNSFEALADEFRSRAQESDSLEIVEITDKRIACKVTRCLGAEALKVLGCPEVCLEYCDTDFEYIKAFNPNMKLIRTKTIAGGDDYCDHIWALED